LRIQLELDDTELEQLGWLKQNTGAKTHKELFINAMTLLDWAVRQRMAVRAIVSVDDSGKGKELQMPALERAARGVVTPNA
jgi:hypothetical protein